MVLGCFITVVGRGKEMNTDEINKISYYATWVVMLLIIWYLFPEAVSTLFSVAVDTIAWAFRICLRMMKLVLGIPQEI